MKSIEFFIEQSTTAGEIKIRLTNRWIFYFFKLHTLESFEMNQRCHDHPTGADRPFHDFRASQSDFIQFGTADQRNFQGSKNVKKSVG